MIYTEGENPALNLYEFWRMLLSECGFTETRRVGDFSKVGVTEDKGYGRGFYGINAPSIVQSRILLGSLDNEGHNLLHLARRSRGGYVSPVFTVRHDGRFSIRYRGSSARTLITSGTFLSTGWQASQPHYFVEPRIGTRMLLHIGASPWGEWQNVSLTEPYVSETKYWYPWRWWWKLIPSDTALHGWEIVPAEPDPIDFPETDERDYLPIFELQQEFYARSVRLRERRVRLADKERRTFPLWSGQGKRLAGESAVLAVSELMTVETPIKTVPLTPNRVGQRLIEA